MDAIKREVHLCTADCSTKCPKNKRMIFRSRYILPAWNARIVWHDFEEECPAYDVEPEHRENLREIEIKTGIDVGVLND